MRDCTDNRICSLFYVMMSLRKQLIGKARARNYIPTRLFQSSNIYMGGEEGAAPAICQMT